MEKRIDEAFGIEDFQPDRALWTDDGYAGITVPEPIDRCEVITVLSGFLLRQRQLRRNGISIGLELIAFNWLDSVKNDARWTCGRRQLSE